MEVKQCTALMQSQQLSDVTEPGKLQTTAGVLSDSILTICRRSIEQNENSFRPQSMFCRFFCLFSSLLVPEVISVRSTTRFLSVKYNWGFPLYVPRLFLIMCWSPKPHFKSFKLSLRWPAGELNTLIRTVYFLPQSRFWLLFKPRDQDAGVSTWRLTSVWLRTCRDAVWRRRLERCGLVTVPFRSSMKWRFYSEVQIKKRWICSEYVHFFGEWGFEDKQGWCGCCQSYVY